MAAGITMLPTPPSRSDPSNFSDRADQFLGQLPLFVSEANTLATDVNDRQTAAAASAAAALLSETNAAAALAAATALSGATKWVSGTSYAEGDTVWSPITYYTYKAKSATNGTVDPSAVPSVWEYLNGGYIILLESSNGVTAAHNTHYIATNAVQTNVLLPSSPSFGTKVKVTFTNGRTDNLINRNTKLIMGLAQNMTIDSINRTVELIYVDATIGWRVLV